MEGLQTKSTNGTKEIRNTNKKMSQRKPPVIKQTLTSIYRMAKANPLLVHNDCANDEPTKTFSFNIQLPKSVLWPAKSVSGNIKDITNSNKCLSNASTKATTVPKNTGTKKKEITEPVITKNNNSTNRNIVQCKRNNSIKRQMPVATLPKSKSQSTSNPSMKTGISQKMSNSNQKTVVKPKRRSLSAEHYDRKKGISKMETMQHMNLNDAGNSMLPPTVSPIIENVRTVTFKTPIACKRRSISMTSITPPTFHRHIASTPAPAGLDLQQRLEKWLRDHRKSPNSYKHLRCFGHSKHNNYDKLGEENKENVEVTQNLTTSTSYEDLKITVPENSASASNASTAACQNENNSTDYRIVAQNALIDLHKLILAGYPHQYCKAWLGMIRHKYEDLDEEAQYWECRAAIEQNRGNITSAVECLHTAIVQGAEVNSVDHSLEQLLEKFSLLNITTSNDKNDTKGTDRERIVLDARNVFKSSIIQFAIQERRLKKKHLKEVPSSETRFVATPVRRSTRFNKSRYLVSPGVQLCASLHELDDNIYNNLEFRSNVALVDKSYR